MEVEARANLDALLQVNYQQVMAKFTYSGSGGPEAKERLRHLFRNQLISISSLSKTGGLECLDRGVHPEPGLGGPVPCGESAEQGRHDAHHLRRIQL